MRLTLKPPSDYLIPSTLHSHFLKPPSLPPARNLKVPGVYTKARRLLNDYGLASPHFLAADKALWWQFVIQAVEWDLENEEVVVSLSDGTEERWDFGGAKSSELCSDDEDDSEKGIASEGDRRDPPSSSQSRWSPETVLARLRRFSLELRSAYEDITTSSFVDPNAPHIETDEDFALLMQLSADPSRKIPFEWTSGKTPYAYFMDEEFVDTMQDVETDTRSTRTESEPEVPVRGQFTNRRRPTRIPLSYENGPTPPSSRAHSPERSHDYLSIIRLLTEIRTYLLDLLPATIYPHLKETVGATYSIWAAEGAITWCRRRAIEQSSEAGRIILDLLDDEPEAVFESFSTASDIDLRSQDSEEFESEDEEEGEGSWGIEIRDTRGKRDDSGWSSLVRMDKRRNENPLASMREDWKLRCWAEDAIERQSAIEREQWLKKEIKPKWTREPGPWEVSIPFGDLAEDDDEEDVEEQHWTRSKKDIPSSPVRTLDDMTKATLRPQKHPLTSPPGSPEDEPSISLPELSAVRSSSSSDDYDDLSNPPSSGGSTSYSDFFFTENYLGEEFLPLKLPKAVVTPSSSRSKEMERARQMLHATLNEIAGLEKKMKELYDFVSDEQMNWDEAIETQRHVKDPHIVSDSGLRTPGASSGSPPATPRAKKDLPLKAQPLRHQTADNLLTGKLALALYDLAPSAKTKKTVKTKRRKQLATPNPRKRQKFNLETLDKFEALKMKIRRESIEGGNKRAKMGSTRGAKGVGRGNGMVAPGSLKRLKKGKGLQREGSHVDLGPSQQSQARVASLPPPSLDPSSSSISSSATAKPGATRLTLFELACRRPPPSSSPSSLPDILVAGDAAFGSQPVEGRWISSTNPTFETSMDTEILDDLTDEEAEFEDENDRLVLRFEDLPDLRSPRMAEVDHVHDILVPERPTTPRRESPLTPIRAFNIPSQPSAASSHPMDPQRDIGLPRFVSLDSSPSPGFPITPIAQRVSPLASFSNTSPASPILSSISPSTRSYTFSPACSTPFVSPYFLPPLPTPARDTEDVSRSTNVAKRVLETTSLITGAELSDEAAQENGVSFREGD
ncbi:hypothetical protein JCM16303_006403 [Sporobolomyces ruberrimus]